MKWLSNTCRNFKLMGNRFINLNQDLISIESSVRLIGPSTEDFIFRGPHMDSPQVLINGLLYIKDTREGDVGGDFAIFKRKYFKNKQFDDPTKNRAFKNSSVKLVKQINYARNRFILFENGINLSLFNFSG